MLALRYNGPADERPAGGGVCLDSLVRRASVAKTFFVGSLWIGEEVQRRRSSEKQVVKG